MAQTAATQLGAHAVAPPGPPVYHIPLPEQHHLEEPQQTPATQLGAGAIAPPATRPSNDDDDDLTYPDLPPFPDDVPTAPLLRLNLTKLARGDEAEKQRLWHASRDLGFFYLDLRDPDASSDSSKRDSAHDLPSAAEAPEAIIDGPALLADAAKLFALGEELYALPVAEKQRYDFKDRGSYFGYKGLGAGVVDAEGTRDRNEFYNVSKDDLLGVGERLPAPAVLREEGNRALLRAFMVRSHAVIGLLLGVLEEKLGLPQGALGEVHRLKGVSGDQVRWVRSPPQVSHPRPSSALILVMDVSLTEWTTAPAHRRPPEGPRRAHRFRQRDGALQPARRAAGPAPGLGPVVLRQAAEGPLRVQPGRRHGQVHRGRAAEQHPPRGQPAGGAGRRDEDESGVLFTAGGRGCAQGVGGECGD